MAVKPTDQPLQTLREATIDQLVMNYGHEELSMEAFDRRLEQALDAKEHAQLFALTEDLELKVDQEYLNKKKAEFGNDFSKQDEVKDVDYMINVFGGSNRRGEWSVTKEIRMLNIFGGGEIDFSDAEFTAPVTRIKLYCILGGARIYVPAGIKVQSRVFSFMGGFDDRAPSVSDVGGPTLIIEGFMFMGGAGVKVKTTFKERLLEFGNSIRSFFEPEDHQQ